MPPPKSMAGLDEFSTSPRLSWTYCCTLPTMLAALADSSSPTGHPFCGVGRGGWQAQRAHVGAPQREQTGRRRLVGIVPDLHPDHLTQVVPVRGAHLTADLV